MGQWSRLAERQSYNIWKENLENLKHIPKDDNHNQEGRVLSSEAATSTPEKHWPKH